MNPKTIGIVIVGIVSVVSMGTETQTSRQEPPDFEAYRIIMKRNMFNPARGIDARQEEKIEPGRREVEAAARARIKVIGIVGRDDPFSSVAIIEENGRHRMCRIGDTVGVMMVVDIRSQETVFNGPGGEWIAGIQPAASGRRAVPSQADPAMADDGGDERTPSRFSGRRVPIHRAQVPRLVRSAKFVADVENGTTRGLRLTEDFMGFKEGDRVIYVGRQSLCTRCPRQKLWQIARKYGSRPDAMPEIQVVVERGNRELEFVLCPYS